MYPYNLEYDHDPNDMADSYVTNPSYSDQQALPPMRPPARSRNNPDGDPGFIFMPEPGSGQLPTPENAHSFWPGPGYAPERDHFREPERRHDREPERHRDHKPPDRHHGDGRERPLGGPPERIPERKQSVFAVDPGAIQGCLYNYVYVWLYNGNSFWIYPTFVGRKSIAGYRWSRFGWVYTGLDLDLIDTFVCIPY